MEEYKANSHKSKAPTNEPVEESKKVEKVVSGTVKTKKKGIGQKFADAFIPEDVESVKDHIWYEIMIPAGKKLIDDIVTNGISMLLYGESGRVKSNTKAGRVSYRDYYEGKNTRRPTSSARTRYDYEDVILDTRYEAQMVLDRMFEIVDEYGMVSLNDLYDLVGITGNYTDNKYGWTDIRGAYVEHVRDGYMIKMPRIVPLN